MNGAVRVGAGRRVAVIGDVAGHLDALRVELARLGVDSGGALPPDLVVVQVGDLVHRGPDSEGVVSLVDGYLQSQPDQWVQLVGNHEAQYLREPAFHWHERIDRGSVDTLRRWWASRQMRAAVALESPRESYLVTHAGLTEPFWRRTLSAPEDAADAADRINQLIGRDDDTLFRAGTLVGRDTVAGPVWASACAELVPSWLDHRLPFSQVHGHTSITDWDSGRFRAERRVGALTVIDKAAKHETTTLTGGRIVGVDPCHGDRAQPVWRAWEAPE
jgi:Calcineurin-like phosphoesterase